MPDDMEPIRVKPTDTLVDLITQDIRDGVYNGRFAPGQRLIVADLSKAFSTSMGPVREAIRRLTGEGLLEFTAHRGASVRTITIRGVRETFQAREAIEGFLANLAAENIGHADYADRLRAWLERMQTNAGQTFAESADGREEFHELLYEFAGNPTLANLARPLTFPIYRKLFNEWLAKTSDRQRQSLIEHQAIIEAILAGDGARAERNMRSHLRNASIAACEAIAHLDLQWEGRRKT